MSCIHLHTNDLKNVDWDSVFINKTHFQNKKIIINNYKITKGLFIDSINVSDYSIHVKIKLIKNFLNRYK